MLARNLERAHRYQIAACIGFYAADRHAHVSTVAGSDGKKQTHHFYMYLIYMVGHEEPRPAPLLHVELRYSLTGDRRKLTSLSTNDGLQYLEPGFTRRVLTP